MRSLPRGPSNSMTHSVAAVAGGASSTNVARAGARRRRIGFRPVSPSVNCLSFLYSNRSTWTVWHTPCDRASSAAAATEAPESAICPAASGATLQNVHSVLADQLVRQGLVVASSVLRRKTDLISHPRATSCKPAGSSRFTPQPEDRRRKYTTVAATMRSGISGTSARRTPARGSTIPIGKGASLET